MSDPIQLYIKSLRSKYKTAEDLPDLDTRLQFVLSGKSIPLPLAVKNQAQQLIQKTFRYAHTEKYYDIISAEEHFSLSQKAPNYSVLMCYDFHYESPTHSLKLIEINTNASGYLLAENLINDTALIEKLMISFANELAMFHSLPLPKSITEAQNILKDKKVAIVDENIPAQKMNLEFLLFKELFERHGAKSELVELSQLEPEKYDFIYNRTTDFYFTNDASTKLRNAYLSQKVCISPNPKEFFLLADKKRLIHFSQMLQDPCFLKTERMQPVNAESLWERRKSLFFKPENMFGGRGAYRGSSVSRKVFDRVIQEKYLAQEYSPAPTIDDKKYDLRFYTYQDQVQLVIARAYSGQVTGFQVAGDGFATVQFN